ncbi:hypothetical protein LSTR_LSTR004422 [Laodelphax striatellus]|uniref:Uncharacterized protein n=1 Tax=Laodelphax striatellus TaxID=195883 RepID=A0A482X9T2_LAOST|nr:hypothetical protein LSTR_LSTR004422 [Laodelphax striatellus]
MEDQFNSPTSSIASKKENKWSAEYVDNSPEFNPISYDFLPQRGSPKGDETPVAKKKRTSLRNLGSSPITANAEQRLLPPPPSERLEDLKKFTNLYKELLSGNNDDEADEQSDSEDLLSDMLNTAECIENIITNQSNDSSPIIRAPAKGKTIRTNSLVNNGATGTQNSSLVRLGESQNSGGKTPRRAVRGESIERIRANSHINNNNTRSSTPRQKANNRLVRSGASDRKSREDTSNPRLKETPDLVPNEILLLNDGNDDGFTSIDDTTLSYLCSGSQTTTTSTQIYNTQDNKCKRDSSKMSTPSSIPAKCISKVSVPSNGSVKISATNKCLTKVAVPNKCSAQEIERKRREAIKRLLERRKINSQIQSQKVS